MSGSEILVQLLYILSASLFIFGLKKLSRVKTSRAGNNLAAFAMFLAVAATLLELGIVDYRWILSGIALGSVIGTVIALRVPMTAMPETVAIFNGFGGAASALVALAVVFNDWLADLSASGITLAKSSGETGAVQALTIVLSILIGAVTLSGSFVAYLKLNGSLNNGKPILLPARHFINLLLGAGIIAVGAYFGYLTNEPNHALLSLSIFTVASLVLGILLVIPIGGADMPVVVSLLNSYSGVAACAAGFVIHNNVLIIAGAMVGAAGLILTEIMCKAMNRSLLNVLVGGFGGDDAAADSGSQEYTNIRSCGAEDAAMVLESATSVVVVPGYGLAVAQAQHAVRELATLLEKRGCKVTYAIHPVAGRMPGHMNVLLAEADVPYEKLLELEQVNPEFKRTDVAIILGANDVVNPAAQENKNSPIYGMPILEAYNATTVFVVKRSLGAGYAGVKNDLFDRDNTTMIFGDAKAVLQDLVREVNEL
ncbi:MAG: NAD(P)(+) transhydrogenase (Re/Si-specific) subunit beta [Myxococcales bacterium]|nr:MAG: NAD(P)(+) transhydrogenase (Re/Si-specific) subunit beta [Myxococcales bacterium]